MSEIWTGFTWLNEPGSWEHSNNVEPGKEEGRGGSWVFTEDGTQLIIKPDSKKVDFLEFLFTSEFCSAKTLNSQFIDVNLFILFIGLLGAHVLSSTAN